MAKGHENLIPMSERTKEEQREIARKGGRASGVRRREKADMRKMAQAILDGTFEDDKGNKFTGVDIIKNGLIMNLSNPSGRNWAKAMNYMIALTGAALSPEQKASLIAQTERANAEIERIKGAEKTEIEDLQPLAEMLKDENEEDDSMETVFAET